MKKTLKIILIAMTAVILLFGMSQTISFAKVDVDTTLTEVNGATGGDIGEASTIGGNIVNWIWGISIVVAVVVLMITGLKFIVGSTQEKAEYKKTMIPYIIGAVLIFAASNVAGMIYDWASTIE